MPRPRPLAKATAGAPSVRCGRAGPATEQGGCVSCGASLRSKRGDARLCIVPGLLGHLYKKRAFTLVVGRGFRFETGDLWRAAMLLEY